jgi:aromatic-L-amino-acid decarboxylase
MTHTTTRPLALEPDAMRAMGHHVVDVLVELLRDSGRPAIRRASADEMAARLPPGAPESGTRFDEVVARLQRDVLPYTGRSDHPGYMAFIPTSGTFPSALGDFIASALNLYAGTWMEGAGPSRVELVVLDWFKQWIGYPQAAAGLLVSGGSAANLTALACAREVLVGPMDDRAVVYMGDQAHSSIGRAARALGFRPDQLRVLPSDGDFRLRPETVATAIGEDVAAGRRPLLVAAAAGATNTGAVDPLPALARVCREHGVWLHVDAAHGGFAALTERGRRALQAFAVSAPYLADAARTTARWTSETSAWSRAGPSVR